MLLRRMKGGDGGGPAASIGAPAEDPCRRSDARRRVLLRAIVHPIDVHADSLILNMSRHGLMGESDAALVAGRTAHFAFEDNSYLRGEIRWTRGRRFGVRLERELLLFPADLETLDDVEVGARPRRVPVRAAARLSMSAPPEPATIRNVSRAGMMLEMQGRQPTGRRLLIELGSDHLFAATVRWCDGKRLGVATDDPVCILALVQPDES